MVERRKREPMSEDEMHEKYPSTKVLTDSGHASDEAWRAVFKARPGAMHSLLADFIKQVYAEPSRIGQRPMPEEERVDLQGLLFAYENELPLREVVRQAMKESRSERAFAKQFYLSRTQFQRMLSGEYEPDVKEMRHIAAVIKKPPAIFVEYRKAMAIEAFKDLIEQRPGIATSLYRKYIEIRSAS